MDKIKQYAAMIRAKLDALLISRYGIDTLSTDMVKLWLILSILNLFIRSKLMRFLIPILLIVAVWRAVSKDGDAREAANVKYLEKRERVIAFFRGLVKK
ncbi:MAG: hypothetical protein IIZ59_03965 [Clostridia bacterium]|nr:hypothetical protein [Clostridia bacterium]